MNLGTISDQLPTYPNNVQGELRVILQTKDVFLICYKHLEEYRRLVNEQNRLITKEFVQEQLQIGEDEISELKMELQDAESRLTGRLRHNELLADHLASLGFGSLESGASVRHLALCRSPQMRKNMLANRQSGGGGGSRLSEPRPPTHMIDNIALAIAEIHSEVRSKVKPLLDYYRDLFYLQLHFSLVLGQVCSYCMPLVTENIGLIDRIFFWSERPEFDLVRRAGDIGDRLKEIYTRAQTVLGVLAESVRFLQSKVELQKTLEQRFHERLDEQQKTKDKILREVHTTKQNMDLLEEENDRLVGSLVKVDPSFVDSRHFYELAEGGNVTGNKKGENVKETAQNNAERDRVNNMSPMRRGQDSDSEHFQRSGSKTNRKLKGHATPSYLENQSEEVNNNKALSLISEIPVQVLVKKNVIKKKTKNQDELESSSGDSKSNMSRQKNRPKSSTRTINENFLEQKKLSRATSNDRKSIRPVSRNATPTPKKSEPVSTLPRRSKSRVDETASERTSLMRENKVKVHRRASSVEKQNKPTIKKSRPKSTTGERHVRDVEPSRMRKDKRSKSSEKTTVTERQLSLVSTTTGDVAEQKAPTSSSLKSRLLGRTKDILEAALNRSQKSSISSEQLSRGSAVSESSLITKQVEHDYSNNDGVTSVSSFASLELAESPLGEPAFTSSNMIIPNRNSRIPNGKKSIRNFTKGRNNRRASSTDYNNNHLALPALSTETLLIEAPASMNNSPLSMDLSFNEPVVGKMPRQKSRKVKKQMTDRTGNFLTGTSVGPLPSSVADSQ